MLVVLFLFFIFITAAVMAPQSFIVAGDQWFENMLLGVRTPFLLNVFGAITFFGNTVVVMGVAGIALLLLWSKRHKAYAAGLATTLIGAAVTDYMMKVIIERARPSGLIPSVIENSFSFPSGHATAAMALYGFMAYVLCKLFPERKPVIVTAAVLIIGSIGFSRLYLGLHFPSDVLAGYLLGGLWLLLGIAVIKRVSDYQ